MKRFSFLILVVLGSASAFAAPLRGVVRDPSGAPIAGAVISIDGAAQGESGADGRFSVDVGAGVHSLSAGRSGFLTESRAVDAAAGELLFVLRPLASESIVVSGIRAEEATPITKTNVTRDDIAREYHQQDIPLLLADVPSISTYTESGIGGSGYSYISLRGVNSSRINFTLDGVPLADSEDMATYFADFPDLASSLQSIQVQRGVGTSTVGSASFGGSVNLQSIDLAATPSLEARIAAGSYGTRFGTVGYQSGTLPGGFAVYSRLSLNETDGFRFHSGVRQRDLFVAAAKQSEKSQLRLTAFTGHERQQMSFLATDLPTLETNVRENPLAPEDRDSFGYDLAQLQYVRSLSPSTNLTASTYYQRGYGWYRLYDDETAKENLRQYGLDGRLFGSLVTLSWTHGPWSANYGVHANEFRRDHTRDLVGGGRDYFNYGVKREANAFTKLAFDRAAWHLYGDLQLRTADFSYHGSVAIDPIRWTFFNPKIGARRDLSRSSSVYVSAGAATREPARNDLFQGEDDATVPHDLHAVRPERLHDFEAGWNLRRASLSLDADVYAMEFRDEIAATGELSDIGLPLRVNVGRSYRRGIELDAKWQAAPPLQLRLTANASRNRIASWTQSYDVYDDAGNYVESRTLVHHDVQPLLTPPLLVNAFATYTAGRAEIDAVARHVARSYLDNSGNSDFVAPAYTTGDLTLSWQLAASSRLRFQINNVTNDRRVYASGYSYLTMTPSGAIGGTAYYYPQAGRNFLLMLDTKL